MISARTTPELARLFTVAPELIARYANTLNITEADFKRKIDEGFSPSETGALLITLPFLISELELAKNSLGKLLNG
jgi:hypothetical protein